MNCQYKFTTVADCYFLDYLEAIKDKRDISNSKPSAKDHNPQKNLFAFTISEYSLVL